MRSVAWRDEALRVLGQSASGDDAVEMRVEREVLSPGVEDGRDAERASGLAGEVARIAAKAGERIGGGTEEEIVDDSGSVERQRAELVRQSEDDVEDVETVDREQVSAPGLEPVCLRQ